MKELWYLFAAYLAIWIGLWVYLISLAARQRGLRRRIEDLKQLLGPQEEPKGSAENRRP